MQDSPSATTLQSTQHSVRLYETLDLSTLHTKVVALKKEVVKVKQGNQFVIIDALGLVLEETILHPQGGGQPADKGYINQIPVVSVKEDKETLSKNNMPTVYHFVDQACLSEKNHHVSPHEEVTLTLDSDTRLTHARFHSAGHLIADIIEQDSIFSDLSGKATAGHHFPNEAYIKIVMDCNIQDRDKFISLLNGCLAEKIKHDLPIFSYHEEGIRHIKIGNFGRKCGGTHVTSTGDIQFCVIKKIKISERAQESGVPFELTIFYTC